MCKRHHQPSSGFALSIVLSVIFLILLVSTTATIFPR